MMYVVQPAFLFKFFLEFFSGPSFSHVILCFVVSNLRFYLPIRLVRIFLILFFSSSRGFERPAREHLLLDMVFAPSL